VIEPHVEPEEAAETSAEAFTPDPMLVAVRRLGTALDRFDDAVARRLGVSRSDLRAMHLLEHGPVTAGAIASHLELTTGSVTALITRLVDAGLATRTVDAHDRRVVRVTLRPEAWQRLADVYGPAGRRVTAYSATLPATRRNHTVRALHDLAAALDDQLDAIVDRR
jgi:DNA-binding MarR family transcriptional regulator